MKISAGSLSIRSAQLYQPWVVPYSDGVTAAEENVPHILSSHAVLHAAKSVGKLAAVFEKLDHTGADSLTDDERATVAAMSADLVTIGLRLANLHDFDLAEVLVERVKEKNGFDLLEIL